MQVSIHLTAFALPSASRACCAVRDASWGLRPRLYAVVRFADSKANQHVIPKLPHDNYFKILVSTYLKCP